MSQKSKLETLAKNPEIYVRCLNYKGDRTQSRIGYSLTYFPRGKKPVYPCKNYESIPERRTSSVSSCLNCFNRKTFSGEYPNQPIYVLKRLDGFD